MSDVELESRPSRKLVRTAIIVLGVAAAFFLLATAVVLVDETELVLVERFGKIVAVYDRPEDRGWHFKCPWPIDVARRFDRRVQLLEPAGRELFTRDKKNITVDVYICWKIAEPEAESAEFSDRPIVQFYRGVGGRDVAEARLDSRVRSVLATHLGRIELSELLHVSDGASEESPLSTIARAVQREVEAEASAEESLRNRFGVEIVDLRIRRIGFPTGNQSAVFERMRSERRKIAEGYRSSGMAENRMIMSRADRQSNEILARAKADAERIRGEAEAESIAILNTAHAQDPELYRTLRTLEAYKAMLGEKTTLVLSASNQLLKLLSDGVPEPPRPAPPATAESP